jgi:phosphatidylserine synthase
MDQKSLRLAQARALKHVLAGICLILIGLIGLAIANSIQFWTEPGWINGLPLISNMICFICYAIVSSEITRRIKIYTR